MRKLLAVAAVALALAWIFMAASGQTDEATESPLISSSTPSGGGQERPFL